MWNWQKSDWPHFQYKKISLELLEAQFLHSSGILLGVLKHLDAEASEKLRIELLTTEALQTSAIEGEILNRESVQSSLLRYFGLQADDRRAPLAEQGIAEMMVDLYRSFSTPLTHEMLFQWHRWITKGRQDLHDVGRYRVHQEAMQVVSGRMDKRIVHFEAPPSAVVPVEMDRFVEWFNRTAPGRSDSLPAITRAAIVHLYFVSIHPFEDGNGRVGRALAEKALAQNLGHPTLLALADAIKRRQKGYYQALEENNQSNEISSWLGWFADTVIEAQRATQEGVEFLIKKTKLLDRLRGQINVRQKKVLLRMLEEGPVGFTGGMSSEKYMRIAATSPATATRDLQDLVEKEAFVRKGERKGTRYFLSFLPPSSQ